MDLKCSRDTNESLVVPHAGVRRRVQCGQELGQRWVVSSHRAFAGGTGGGGRTKAWASGARPFEASKQIAMSRAQQRIESSCRTDRARRIAPAVRH